VPAPAKALRRFPTGRLAFVALIIVVMGDGAGRVALAGPVEDAVKGLASPSGETILANIKQLSTLGDPRGIAALQALTDDRLRVGADGNAWIYDKKTRDLVDPFTGAAAPPSAKPAREVETDNDIRRAAEPVLAELQLGSPEASVRLGAAQELSRSGSEGVGALLHRALDREKDKGVQDALAMAVARVDVGSNDANLRLAAVKLIQKSGNDEMLGELQRLLGVGADGKPNEPDDRVRDGAQDALKAVMNRRRLITGIGSIIHGLSLASVLLFAALGLAITFGLLGVINMAHGEMLMLGAYATYAVQTFFQSHLPNFFGLYLFAAIPVAFFVTFGVGVLLERVVIRHLYNRPLETLLATWGISLLLIQSVRLIFGAQNVAVANPDWLAGGVELAHGLVLPYNRIGVVAFVIAVSVAVWALLYKTRIGLNVRAMTQNRNMAACVGIHTRRLDSWMFGLGSGIAGLGGVALSQLGNVGPELGQSYIIDSFMVVVLGGVGRLAGAIVSALGLGIVNKLLEPVAGAVLGKILVLGFIILFIQRRPQGLFAIKGRTEA